MIDPFRSGRRGAAARFWSARRSLLGLAVTRHPYAGVVAANAAVDACSKTSVRACADRFFAALDKSLIERFPFASIVSVFHRSANWNDRGRWKYTSSTDGGPWIKPQFASPLEPPVRCRRFEYLDFDDSYAAIHSRGDIGSGNDEDRSRFRFDSKI